jgi:acyl-coenzyme A thioesterase PaaI-like protein
MIDLVAGFLYDDDPATWVMTTDMSVRMQRLAVPGSASTRCTFVRRGGRSATAVVDLVTDLGQPMASGAISFVKVPRREGGPIKPENSPERVTTLFDGSHNLIRPLRDAASISVIDSMTGTVEMEVTSALRNPAGTLQGAMVALVAEVAAEEMASARFESPAVVTDLDLRYLAQSGAGPVRTRSSLLGQGPEASIQVEIFDQSSDRLTTLVYARTVIPPL